MEAMRDAWTDERLDDLANRVDEGFGRFEREFQVIRLEMRTEFSSLRSELQVEFGAVRSEANATYRTLLQVILGGFALMLAGFAGTIATILIQN